MILKRKRKIKRKKTHKSIYDDMESIELREK